MRLGHPNPRLWLTVGLIGAAAACSVPGQPTPPGSMRTQQIQQSILTSQGGLSQGYSQISGPGYSYGYSYGPGYNYSFGPGNTYNLGPNYGYDPSYDYDLPYSPHNRWNFAPGYSYIQSSGPGYGYSSGPGYISNYRYGPGQAIQSSQQSIVFGGY
jgi:hypothetical protein